MSEKREPLHPVRPPQTAKERAEWGRMKEPAYGDTPGKKLGNWLMNLLTPWKG